MIVLVQNSNDRAALRYHVSIAALTLRLDGDSLGSFDHER